MRFIPALCGAIVFSGCGDTSLLKVSFAPNVVITSPMDESLYEEGDIVDLRKDFRQFGFGVLGCTMAKLNRRRF